MIRPVECSPLTKPDVIVESQLEPPPHFLCVTHQWCLCLLRLFQPWTTLRPGLPSYSIQAAELLKMQGYWGCLLNTLVTMHGINPEDHQMKVIKLPSSIMNGTISRGSGLLLWGGWMGEEALCAATSVSCCKDDDYDDSADDDDGEL